MYYQYQFLSATFNEKKVIKLSELQYISFLFRFKVGKNGSDTNMNG